jgi:hypothetical protein
LRTLSARASSRRLSRRAASGLAAVGAGAGSGAGFVAQASSVSHVTPSAQLRGMRACIEGVIVTESSE